MLSRIFLILAGLFAGLWLRDGSGTLFTLGFPALSLLALLFAVAATPPSLDRDARGRLEEAFRNWLDAWHRLRTAPDKDRFAVEQALTSAAHAILVTANDRVVKSLLAAMNQQSSPDAVAQLVLDMRRSLRRAGMSVRAEDLAALLTPAGNAPANGRPAAPTRAPNPASFLG